MVNAKQTNHGVFIISDMAIVAMIFFDQCQHRMACARCAFYITKSSTKGQWLAASEHLKRMAQTITLTDAERAAVDDGIEASQRLIAMLTDQPTPDQGRIIEPDDIVGGVTDDD